VTNPGNYSQFPGTFTPTQASTSVGTYTGISLFSFLNPSGPDISTQILIAEATDGYEVVFALGELMSNPSDLLAYASSNTDFPKNGIARTVLPDDLARGRWVSNVAELDVIPGLSVPGPIAGAGLPASLPLALVSSHGGDVKEPRKYVFTAAIGPRPSPFRWATALRRRPQWPRNPERYIANNCA
jgi:hypothetical protein